MNIEQKINDENGVVRKIIDGVVVITDIISIGLASEIVIFLNQQQSGVSFSLPSTAKKCAITIITKSLLSLFAMAALIFYIKPGKRNETTISLICVTILSIILLGMGAYFIDVTTTLEPETTEEAQSINLFKTAGAFQIITGVVEIITYIIAYVKTSTY